MPTPSDEPEPTVSIDDLASAPFAYTLADAQEAASSNQAPESDLPTRDQMPDPDCDDCDCQDCD